MKTIKFLQESFETKEGFQQEISFKYSYNRNAVARLKVWSQAVQEPVS